MYSEVLRLGFGTALFFLNMVLAHVVYDASDIRIAHTVQLESVVITIALFYLTAYVLAHRGWNYESKYRPPFTTFYVMVHVYGLGVFVVMCVYGLFCSTFQLTLIFICSLVSIFFDDILFNNSGSPLEKVFLITNVVSAGCVCGIISLEYKNYVGIVEMMYSKDLSSVMFAYVIPVVSPVVMTMFRTSHYCTRLHDAVLDIIKFALPFSVLMAIPYIFSPATISPTASAMNFFSDILQSREKVVCLLLLPLSSLLSLCFLFYNILTYNTVDAIMTLSMAIACRYLWIENNATAYSIHISMCMSFMILVRMFYMYAHRRANTKNILPQHGEYYEDDETIEQSA
jgi:hypothetical protein